MGRSRKVKVPDNTPGDLDIDAIRAEESLDELQEMIGVLLIMLQNREVLDAAWWLRMVALKIAISHWGE